MRYSPLVIKRYFATGGKRVVPPKIRITKVSEIATPNVITGLSNAVVKVPKNTPVGPGAVSDGEYKNPEYYCYNISSYYEAEVELQKYRGPVPDCRVPFK